MRKVSPWYLLSIHTFCGIQRWWKGNILISMQMYMLIWDFALRICLRTHFRIARPNFHLRTFPIFSDFAKTSFSYRSGYHKTHIQVSILHKSIVGRYRPVRAVDGPITAGCRFMKTASWDGTFYVCFFLSN